MYDEKQPENGVEGTRITEQRETREFHATEGHTESIPRDGEQLNEGQPEPRYKDESEEDAEETPYPRRGYTSESRSMTETVEERQARLDAENGVGNPAEQAAEEAFQHREMERGSLAQGSGSTGLPENEKSLSEAPEYWVQMRNKESGIILQIDGEKSREAMGALRKCVESGDDFHMGGVTIETKTGNWEYRDSNTMGFGGADPWLMMGEKVVHRQM